MLAKLRDEIVNGVLPPGSQLPTRADFERRFCASPHTVQRAIDQLRREGFVRVNGRQATYVTTHPPHLYRYAMVFNSSAHDGVNRFFLALTHAAEHYTGSESEPRHVTLHSGVEDHADNREMRALAVAVRGHTLAGIVFPEHPHTTRLGYSILGTAPGLPRVSMLAEPTETIGAVSMEPFEERVLDYFRRRKCRRVAVLTNAWQQDVIDRLTQGISRRGMTTRSYWLLRVNMDTASTARETTHLLLHAGQDERPDALFITDDNLVEHALAGIVDAGVRVPEDLEVVTHCNFPWPVPSVLRVKRIGYDTREVLAACLDELESQRRGERPGLRTVQAKFEEDLA